MKPRGLNKPRRVIYAIDELPVICDSAEVGLLLRVTPERVNALARSGELPGVKLCGAWKFKRDAVLTYFDGLFRAG